MEYLIGVYFVLICLLVYYSIKFGVEQSKTPEGTKNDESIENNPDNSIDNDNVCVDDETSSLDDEQCDVKPKSFEASGNDENIQSNLDDFYDNVYIDTETSSLEIDRGEVLQLSAIKIMKKESNLFELCVFNEYIQPSQDIRIDYMSMKVNGISLGKCKCPKQKAFQDFLDFCEGKNICGYNVDFDIDMIDDDMSKEGFNLFEHIKSTRDVLKEVRNNMLPIQNNKLSTVSKYLGFDCDKFHNALFDCLATMFVDIQLRYEGKIKLDYDEIINALPKDNDDALCNVSDDKCKEFFNGKNVCISGDFENINRKYLEDKVVECGGVIKSGMSKKVDIFISGINFKPTSKEKRYDELLESGCDKIVRYNEAELMKMIS